MSKRNDIRDGRKDINLMAMSGLIYTCNCGWLDLGHLTPTNPRREIGAENLWKQLNDEGEAVLKSDCKRIIFNATVCKTDPQYRFPDGKTGFLVHYRQDHQRKPLKPGSEGKYIVKHGLLPLQKKSVALAIFMEVSLRFENLQSLFSAVTDSGFSQEDLISNLIGFYIGVNEVQRLHILKKCHPVSAESAFAIWDRDGPVGKNKNANWKPRLADDALAVTDTACEIECKNQPKIFPSALQRIQPAIKGRWHVEL
jgi:hypothetical protein